MASSMTNSVSWQELYTTAMLELDRAALAVKIEAAQAAVLQATEELADNHTPRAGEEKQALADALRNVHTTRPPRPAPGRGIIHEAHVPRDDDANMAQAAACHFRLAPSRQDRD
jgi:hypothetical protein